MCTSDRADVRKAATGTKIAPSGFPPRTFRIPTGILCVSFGNFWGQDLIPVACLGDYEEDMSNLLGAVSDLYD